MVIHEKARLFTAVPLDPPARFACGEQIRELRSRLSFRRWVHPGDLHITLFFLGDTEPGRADSVLRALSSAAAAAAPFSLALNGLGVFGRPAAPRILYAGVTGDLRALACLQKEVVRCLEPLGYAAEVRPYRPHLTIARNYEGKEPLPGDVIAGEFSSAGWTVREFVLFRTHMGRSPMYEAIARFPLKGRPQEVRPGEGRDRE